MIQMTSNSEVESNTDTNVDTQKYFWSPSVKWYKEDENLYIEVFQYPEYVADMFPQFYYFTQNGVTKNQLFSQFNHISTQKLSLLINDLIKKKVLVNTILTPHEIFFTQNKLFENKYGEEILYNPAELDQFKKSQLSRSCFIGEESYSLGDNHVYPDYLEQRISYREFNTKEIQFERFSRFLSILKQKSIGEHIQYYYASAGGLYPVDIYLYVKENRVESVKQGVYYYSPVNNSIELIDDQVRIDYKSHYLTNQDIFKTSAFTIYFVYNAEVTMPKYGGMGYFYACIDTGIIVSTLTQAGEHEDIGLCSIGDMNFNKIKEFFHFTQNQVLLHSMECGNKPE